jgi:hypothetical protein
MVSLTNCQKYKDRSVKIEFKIPKKFKIEPKKKKKIRSRSDSMGDQKSSNIAIINA